MEINSIYLNRLIDSKKYQLQDLYPFLSIWVNDKYKMCITYI